MTWNFSWGGIACDFDADNIELYTNMGNREQKLAYDAAHAARELLSGLGEERVNVSGSGHCPPEGFKGATVSLTVGVVSDTVPANSPETEGSPMPSSTASGAQDIHEQLARQQPVDVRRSASSPPSEGLASAGVSSPPSAADGPVS